MSGCEGGCCAGHDDQFDEDVAEEDLIRYRDDGPDRTSALLLDALRREGIAGATLLDIGGGVGVMQHELIADGVVAATAVDAARAYADAAQDEAERRAYAAPVTRLVGDFVALADEIAPADIVTLDKVICCYEGMEALVSRSAARARRLYGLVYPRDAWWTRLGVRFMNLPLLWRRDGFRIFVHSTSRVAELARDAGLAPASIKRSGFWEIAVYRRSAA